MISLNVPDDFVLDEWWNSVPSELVANALNLIPQLIRKTGIASETLKRIDSLQAELNSSRTVVEETKKECRKTMEEVIDLKQKECNRLEDHVSTLREWVRGRQVMPYSAPSSPTIDTKDAAWNVICECINCEIDVARQIVCTEEGMRMMMFVSDAPHLNYKDDIEAFKKRVLGRAEDVNCALFLSINTSSIPNHGPGCCGIDILHAGSSKVPVLFLASRTIACFNLAARALQHMVRTQCTEEGGEDCEKERSAMQEHIPYLLDRIVNLEQECDARIHMLSALMDSQMREKQQFTEIHVSIEKLRHQVPWICTQEEHIHNKAEQIICDYFASKQVLPKTSNLTGSQRASIKAAGGMKVVLKRLMLKGVVFSGPS